MPRTARRWPAAGCGTFRRGLIKDMIVFLTENQPAALRDRQARRPGKRGSHRQPRERARPPGLPEEALDLLFLLTCADIAATNERAYSGYTAATLATLFLRTSAAVSRVQAAQGNRRLSRSASRLSSTAGAGSRVSDFVRALGPRYCLANLPAGILRTLAMSSPLSRRPFACASRVQRSRQDQDHRPGRIGLFSLLSGILLANGADIVRARIHTFDGIAIDEFIVADVHGNEILEQKMEKELSIWIADLRASFERYWRAPAIWTAFISEIGRRTRLQRGLCEGHAGRDRPRGLHRPAHRGRLHGPTRAALRPDAPNGLPGPGRAQRRRRYDRMVRPRHF